LQWISDGIRVVDDEDELGHMQQTRSHVAAKKNGRQIRERWPACHWRLTANLANAQDLTRPEPIGGPPSRTRGATNRAQK